MLTGTQIDSVVSFPSLGAATYQAESLLRELSLINDEEYPPQAAQIRDVYECIAHHVLGELCGIRSSLETLDDRQRSDELSRARALRRIVQTLHSYVRYLRSALHPQSPPGLQVALTQLTDLHFPKDNGAPISLVRPQWNYNLECVDIGHKLLILVHPDILDPQNRLSASTSDQLLDELWTKWLATINKPTTRPTNRPKQLAILSFAGLDRHDTLSYALLAHELGHFIDFSYEIPLHRRIDLKTKSRILIEEVQAILAQLPDADKRVGLAETVLKDLVDRTFTCLRELIADLLAVRMMGLSFFMAQAEFLKGLSSWLGSTIHPSGYPGIVFRLSTTFGHLMAESNLVEFLAKHEKSERDKVSPIQRYLEAWQKLLHSDENRNQRDTFGNLSPEDRAAEELETLLEERIRRTLPDLEKIAREVVPAPSVAALTPSFFEKIERLQNDLPPYAQGAVSNSFAEIMSASWAFRLLQGYDLSDDRGIEEHSKEYSKTGRLVLKAIELTAMVEEKMGPIAESTDEPDLAEENGTKGNRHGVLSAGDINYRMRLPVGDPSHLSIVPMHPEALQGASLDVRLGNWFVVSRRTRLRSVELGNELEEQLLLKTGRDESFVHANKTFLIHPGDLVLGATLEFIGLPSDLMAFVEGRSGLGRLGLSVATATQIAPGFHGVIVLELSNTGGVPIVVKPGISIAQLVFQTMTRSVGRQLYRGKYYCQIKP